jgi:ABC-type multidrug transport system fused ATPase/permease subunit
MEPSYSKKLWRLLTPAERRKAIMVLALSIVGMALETLGIGFVIPAIAILTQPQYVQRFPALRDGLAALGNPGPTELVIWAMVALTVIFIVKNVFLAFLTWYQTRYAYRVQARMSQQLFDIYLRQPYTFHLQRNSALLLRNVTGEIDTLRSSALISGMLLISECCVLLGLFTLLTAVEPLGALIVVVVLGLASWAFHRLTRAHVSRWGVARQRHEGLRIQHLQQGLGGAKDVKLLGREAEFLALFRSHNEQNARVGHLQFTLLQFPRMWLELLAVGGLAILVLIMIAQGRSPEAVLPTLGLFAAAAFRMLPSANRVLGAIQGFRFARPVITSLYSEFALAPPPAVAMDKDGPAFEKVLELRDVTFTYAGASTPALDSLSLQVRRGESVGFIGPSGSGKSTLVDVLLGLLTPEKGQVCVDGEDIRRNPRRWQSQIGYVPQSIYLTDDTLRRNVAFGLADGLIDEIAIERALRAASLDEFVRSLPHGLDTVVGERGVRLSGGQRQRIGIARALYHDPAVLVLDEATSSLDTETERSVMESVVALQANKTVIIVAHRLSTVEHCDRLYRLERGGIVDEGATATMLAASRLARPA